MNERDDVGTSDDFCCDTPYGPDCKDDPFKVSTEGHVMMKNTVDYNATADQLGMGDRFQLSQHGPITTVAWIHGSTDNSVLYVHGLGGELFNLKTYLRVHVVEFAPRCDCGRRFENCEQDCPWPATLEALLSV